MGKLLKSVTAIMVLLLLGGCIFNNDTESGSSKKPGDQSLPLSVKIDQNSDIKDHGTNISLTPSALLDFSNDIDASSISQKSIILKDIDNKTVDYNLILQKNKVAINVNKPLQAGKKYTITVTDMVADKTGIHSKPAIFDFTTGDKVYPVAYLLTPEDLDNTSQTPNISFDFNGPVKNVDPSTVSLLDDSGNAVEISDIVNNPLLGSDDVDARYYNFFPKKPLLPYTHYHIVLSSEITDLAGNHLKLTRFDITTGEYIRPEILLKAPDNLGAVSQNPSFEFNISGGSSEDPDSFRNIDSDHIYLIDKEDSQGTQTHINLAFIKGGSNNSYVAMVQDDNHPVLLPNRHYAIVFSSEISDKDGNHIASELKIDFTTTDSIIPDVSMLDPENNASNISQKPTLAFFFAGAIGGMQNVDSDNIYLMKESGGSKVGLNIAANGDGLANNFVATLADDSKPLAANTRYNIVFSSDIQDKFGNHIKQVTYNFKTGDTMFPTAAIISPANKAVDITKHPLIQVMFSTPVNLAKNQNVLLLDDKGNHVTISDIDYFSEKKIGDITYKNVYSFSPESELDGKKTYTIKLTSDITDTLDEPNHLKETLFIFTTSQKNNPTASLMQPLNNDTGVSISQLIKVRFSTAVQGASNDTVQLHEGTPDGKVVAAVSSLSSPDNIVYTIHPPTLKAVTKYYVTFSDKISSLNTEDHMINPQPVYFTTGNSQNATVQLTSPKSNQEGVSIRTSIKLTFSSPVTNVGASTVTLTNCKAINPDKYPYTPPSGSGYKAEYELIPLGDLPANQKICVNIKSGIFDSANTPASTAQLSFTTGSKVVPTVDLTSGISDVDIDSNLVLAFSSTMKNVEQNISIHTGASDGAIVTFTSKNVERKVYTITPNSKLQYNTSYYIVINSGISDDDGNPLAARQIVFTTIKYTPPPPPPPIPDFVRCTLQLTIMPMEKSENYLFVLSGLDSCRNLSNDTVYRFDSDTMKKVIQLHVDGKTVSCDLNNDNSKCKLGAFGVIMDDIKPKTKIVIDLVAPKSDVTFDFGRTDQGGHNFVFDIP